MSKRVHISIPTPCHENWAAMTPVEKGKFCPSCQKVVHDFTRSSDREIARLLKMDGETCGRFRNSQLDRDLILPKEKNGRWLAAGTAAVSFLALGTGAVAAQQTRILVEQHETQKDNTPNRKNGGSGLINGVVNDETGLPVPGVNIINKNSKNTTSTDLQGNFSIKAEIGDVIEFSLPGMLMQQATIDLRENLEIILGGSEDVIIVEGCNGLRRESVTVGATMTIISIETIEKKRTFFGRIFHSIGDLFR